MHFLLALVTTVTLGVADRVNANASIAADGNTVAVAWGATKDGGGTDVYAAASGDGGARFGPPVRVNDGDGDARVTGEQPPRVAVRAGQGPASIWVSWVSKRDETTIRVARSVDGGRSWGPSRSVSAPNAPGNRGWHAMTLDALGNPLIVWLDHGEMAAMSHHGDASSHGTRDGAAMAQMSSIVFARVTDAGVEPERRITSGVCYCCKTTLAAGPGGEIVAAWRHVYPGNIRDIAFAVSRDGRTFSAPERVSEDRWQIEGCPENGPAAAVDASGRIHVVWPTVVAENGEQTLSLFHASSFDGRTFGSRERIPDPGTPRHPQLAVGPGGVVTVAWDSLLSGTRRVRIARGTTGTDGHVHFAVERLDDDRGAYPVVASAGDRWIAAWTSPGNRIIVGMR